MRQLNDTAPTSSKIKRNKLTDEMLLRAISDNARLSSEKIAKKLNISPTTIRRRIKAATRKGLIHTKAVVDPVKAGLNIQAVFGFKVSHEHIESVLNALERQPEINWLAAVAGGFDIIARAAFHSTEELSTFLRETIGGIKGINNTESFISLDIPKGRFISPD